MELNCWTKQQQLATLTSYWNGDDEHPNDSYCSEGGGLDVLKRMELFQTCYSLQKKEGLGTYVATCSIVLLYVLKLLVD